MTRTTTGADRLTKIFSWLIALFLAGGLVYLFWRLPSPENQTLAPIKKPEQVSRQIKEEQAQRPLPPDYAQRLVEQSEVLVRQELEDRLRRFQVMSDRMDAQKDTLLTLVENRRLPASAPRDANNTSQARAIPRANAQSTGNNPSIQALYGMLREFELEIQRNHLAVTAARQALSGGLSFPEVYRSLTMGSSLMPDFENLISRQTGGEEWTRSQRSNASAGLQISSTADLNNYRGLLGEASRQSALAGTRLEGLFGIPRSPGAMMAGGSGGDGTGDGGMAGVTPASSSQRTLRWRTDERGRTLNVDMVKAQALPGRRFSRAAERQGWLYVNTWYMIGPWENFGIDDFTIVHPPEISIDFDAVYTNGKVGTGRVETDSHPLKMIGNDVRMDGTLRWQFKQSESMHNAPPVTASNATYYAYTELYFDEAITMMVAIGTDDSGKIWINGRPVFQDSGSSWYYIDEHIAPFDFQQGWNRILVRLENGDGPAGFSFLILPR